MWLKIITLLFAFNVSAQEAEKKGLEIAKQMQKANENYVGESAITELTLINAQGQQVKREMNYKAMEVKDKGTRSLITFISPSDVRGTKLLTWTHKSDQQDDQWLYLPSFKRVKRINAQSKSGSFMGSEFTFEDLGSQEIEKYDFTWLKDEKQEEQEFNVLQRISKDKFSGYGKQILWVDKATMLALKIEYYDKKGDLLKTAHLSEKTKIKNWWRTNKIEISNHQNGKKSIFTWKNRELGEKFNEADFKTNRL
jgi:negative regulator of sigma E activity